MTKARNGIRYSTAVKKRAKLLPTEGKTHREIAKELGARISTIHLWTTGIFLSPSQKQGIEARRNQHKMNAFIAGDGHICDSFSERIIDDWFSKHKIVHERNVRYRKTKFTADFKIGSDTFVEFFGLAGVQKAYDKNIKKKRLLAHEMGYRLIEIYPEDIYPKNKLPILFGAFY